MARHRFIQVIAWLPAVLVVVLLAGPISLPADQAQYFYDELGRLVGVVDGSGNVAVYNYDAVGNLLSIQRFTTGTSGIGIFLIAPDSGLVGANVQIQGFGFSAMPANNQVAFNGTPATVVAATASSIVVTVPTGATTGPVTVTNANGTATSPQAFTVLVPPIISGIDPAIVPQGTTARVIIAGFNLSTATAVTFTQTGLSATILAGATAQSLPINLTVAGTVPVGAYAFSVASPLGTAQSGTVIVAVAPAVPTSSVGQGSVFKPFPAQTPPAGPTAQVGEASVFKPYPAQVPPAGPTANVGKVSVSMP